MTWRASCSGDSRACSLTLSSWQRSGPSAYSDRQGVRATILIIAACHHCPSVPWTPEIAKGKWPAGEGSGGFSERTLFLSIQPMRFASLPTPHWWSKIVSCYGSAPRTQWFHAGQSHMVAFQQGRFHIWASQRKLAILDPFKPCPGTVDGINFANLRRWVSCRNVWSVRSPRSPLCKVESWQYFAKWPAQGEV